MVLAAPSTAQWEMGKVPKDKCELIARSENDRYQDDGSTHADQKEYENFTRSPLLIGEDHMLLIKLQSLPGCT